MLTIRKEQMAVFNEAVVRKFEDEMAEHCHAFAPQLCEEAGCANVATAVRKGLKNAERYGFSMRGPLRFYIEMMLTFGSDFDTDPQLPWVAEELGSSEIKHELLRADRVFRRVNEYWDRVMGPDNEFALMALRKAAQAGPEDFERLHGSFETRVQRMLSAGFPQKWLSLGEEGFGQLIRKSQRLSTQLGVDAEPHRAFLVVLMFAFGHGVVDDPLYPWIGVTLWDASTRSPEDRIARLLGKTRLYAEEAAKNLAANKKGIDSAAQ
jgi:hypothetical protein